MLFGGRSAVGVLPTVSRGLAPALAVSNAVVGFSRRKPLGAIGGAIFVTFVVVAIVAPLIAPYDPRETRGGHEFDKPSTEFLLGTDYIGRDMLSRIIWGARVSLYVAIGSVLIGLTAGFILGIVSSYAGGAVDLSFQRLVDAAMAISGLIIALAIMAVLGRSLENVIIAIVIGMIAPVVRTIRSQVLSLKEMDYVLAARAVGANPLRIIFRHIAPNCFAIYLIMATYYLGFAIILEASLSFLGVGSPPDQATWGGMLTAAQGETWRIADAFWAALFPGLAIFIVVLGVNLLGDALRDVMDPRLRGSR